MAMASALPEFTVKSDKGLAVTRNDMLGHTTVLWFYPKADTPG